MTCYPYGRTGDLVLDTVDATPRTQALESVVGELGREIAKLEALLLQADADVDYDHEAGQLHAYTLTHARLRAVLAGGTP
jgi:hypothetical protein